MAISRALLSVSDKSGLSELAAELLSAGVEILSTGGSAKTLRKAGHPVTDVADVTGFPEIMDGRVKTLHPLIHGGILARRGTDEAIMETHRISGIDLVVVNLYPFAETVNKPVVDFADAIENIDIGGPAMIRAAAKNHRDVFVVVDPDDYGLVVEALKSPDSAGELRAQLARKAFLHTASYDAAISDYLQGTGAGDLLDKQVTHAGSRLLSLRYGENPHQAAAFYQDGGFQHATLAGATQVQGKALSYNNIADGDAALECVRQFDEPACVIVKHANPCGVAVAANIADAYESAYSTDPTSAFGGIIAFNRPLDAATAATITERQFVEVLLVPSIDDDALKVIATKKNLRLMVTGELGDRHDKALEFKKVSGGLLVQERDDRVVGADELRVVSKRTPSDSELRDMLFAWQVVKYVKSNAIVFCKNQRTIGVGAGQMSRVYSTRIAAIKAADENLDTAGCIMASDAFFPFRDGIDSAVEHGITAVIQPGGSMRDQEVIDAANEHGLAMAFTGIRHFRH